MSVTIQALQIIDRPVSIVFHFYADEHVRNHPRWDPDIHLENPSAEALRIALQEMTNFQDFDQMMEMIFLYPGK